MGDLQETFRELLSRTIVENQNELNYWSGKFRGKIPKSVKHRMEKLKYVISLRQKAEQEKQKENKDA